MANYISNSLEKGEQIVYKGHLHWIFIYKYILTWVGLLLVAGGVAFYGYHVDNSLYYYIAGGLLFVAIVVYIIGRIIRTRSEFAVTTSRFIQKDGIFNIKMTEIPLFKIETVNLYQSFWQRIIGTGCIELVGSGGTFHRVDFIKKPLTVRRTVVSAINKNNNKEIES